MKNSPANFKYLHEKCIEGLELFSKDIYEGDLNVVGREFYTSLWLDYFLTSSSLGFVPDDAEQRVFEILDIYEVFNSSEPIEYYLPLQEICPLIYLIIEDEEPRKKFRALLAKMNFQWSGLDYLLGLDPTSVSIGLSHDATIYSVELLKVFQQPSEEAIYNFLNSWYDSHKGAAWHGSHEENNKYNFTGYRFYGAGALVKATGISSERILNHPHFPKEFWHSGKMKK